MNNQQDIYKFSLKLSAIIKNRYSKKETKILTQTKTSKIYCVGFTGAPGVGKSSLINNIAKYINSKDKDVKIGILLFDPLSKFTGGGFLGDRIRMQNLSIDSNIFIRSIGVNNDSGGVDKSLAYIIKLFEQNGFDYLFIETVGAGQNELAIDDYADTIIVVKNSQEGDEIQHLKSGIMEIADIFVINKIETPCSVEYFETFCETLKTYNSLYKNNWKIQILKNNNFSAQYTYDIVNAIYKHKQYLIDKKMIGTKSKRI